MRFTRIIWALAFPILLVNCGGGSSGANGDDPFNNDDNAVPVEALVLSVLNAQCQAVTSNSFASNETICVRATLTLDGVAANNEVIGFSTSALLGELSATTALTNSSGVAEITITNPNTDVGASNLTATYNNTTITDGFEYLAEVITVVEVPEVNVNLFLNGEAVTRFQAGQDVQLQARVLDANDAPLAEQLVTFSVSGVGPILSPNTGLTNADGVAQVTLSATDVDIGAYAAQANVTIDGALLGDAVNFEVQVADTIIETGETRFGSFDEQGVFIEGQIGSTVEDDQGEVVISAGATVGFNVALVDENDVRIQTPTAISFSSTCVTNGDANLDAVVTTVNGEASSTFEDLSCAGSTGNTDQIIASVVVNNATLSLSRDLTIQPENIGSIAFISATPDEIVLEGTGGQNASSISILTFQVNGELGNPLAQQQVDFSLNTTTGGLTLEPATGLTNSEGQVSTRVSAGSVPTSIRVTAEVDTLSGTTIRTQSDLLSVNTGLPDQNSFTLTASPQNPEADVINTTVEITVRLADSFNNPVPNGTTVSFTTEGGSIQPSCITGADADGVIDPDLANTGTCSVTWATQNPRPADNRVTILATAIGHETLIDNNGNNAYDDSDGGAISDGTDSGFGNVVQTQPGFVDHSEAWRDDNENNVRDNFEVFIDYNGDQAFNAADGLFNGPQCNSATGCGTGQARTLHVRKAMVLVMATSDALWRVYNGDLIDENIVFTSDADVISPNSLILAPDEVANLSVVYYGLSGQVMPAGTQFGTVDTSGNLEFVQHTVNSTTRPDPSAPLGHLVRLQTLTNPAPGTTISTDFNFVIQTPSGRQTNVGFTVGRSVQE